MLSYDNSDGIEVREIVTTLDEIDVFDDALLKLKRQQKEISPKAFQRLSKKLENASKLMKVHLEEL